MEKRTITQVKVHFLVMNDMRSPKIEYRKIVIGSYDVEKLRQWYINQYAESMWHDDRFGKVFKKDSPLEWMNEIDLDHLNSFGHGLFWEWVEEGDTLTFPLINESF